MIDVDARGRHEAELLREEAARMADTETALPSVLDGVVLVLPRSDGGVVMLFGTVPLLVELLPDGPSSATQWVAQCADRGRLRCCPTAR